MKTLTIFFLFLSVHSMAQNRADSLWKAYQLSPNEETAKELGRELPKQPREKALQMLQQIQEYERMQQDEVLAAVAFNTSGNLYYASGDFQLAEKNFLSALEVWKKKDDKKGIAAMHNNLGSVYQSKGDYAKALEHHLASLRIKEELKDEKGIGVSYNNLANVYRKINQPEKALEYHQLSLTIKEKLNDVKGISLSLSNIANTLFELKKYKEAFSFYNRALDLQLKMKDDLAAGNTYNSLGFLSTVQEDYPKALDYFNRAINCHNKTGNKNALATTYTNLGALYLKQNMLTKAEQYYQQALQLGKSIGDKESIQDATKNLGEILAKKNDYEKAIALMKESEKFKDSIFNIQSQRAMAEMQTKYETEKKETAIKLLKKENELKEIRNRQILIAGSGIVLLLLFGAVFLHSYQKILQKKKLAEERAQMEKARLQSVIRTQEEERKRISAELHDGIGPTLSAAKLSLNMVDKKDGDAQHYNNALALIDRSYKELRAVSHAMMPAVLTRLGLAAALEELAAGLNRSGKINVQVYASEPEARYPELVEIHLYRITQELLNNILKHANASEVQIQLNEEHEDLQLMIEDNGSGFDTNLLKNSKGHGWYNISSRLTIIDGSIEIDSRPGKKGTASFITVPLKVKAQAQ